MGVEDRAKGCFLEGVALSAPERVAWLAALDGEEPGLRERVEQLLAAHARAERAVEACRAGGALGLELPVRFGGYELLQEVAAGGAGVVYRARQLELGRTVAVKLLRAGLLAGEAELRRFRTEAEAAARLDHPAIVPVHEVGVCEGRHFISMKLVEGASLDRCAARFRAPRDAAALVARIARAVDHAHRHGVLHRDLKPSNVLVDERGSPYVADFGTAKLLDAEGAHTATGWLVGTPAYMAPEQATAGGTVTVATDVHALGCVLFELLAGRPPFAAGDVVEQLRLVREEPPPSLRTLQPELHRDLETICVTCLAKEPARRYASAQALAGDLERWLAFEPIAARRTTAVERAWLAWRRRPLVSTLAAAVALLLAFLAIGAVVASVQLRALLSETREAESDTREQLRRATAAEALAVERADEVLRLAALQDHAELVARADELWPSVPARIPELEAWIADARALVAELPGHRRRLEALRSAALPVSDLEAERRAHPHHPLLFEMRGQLAWRRAALRQRRDGIAVETPQVAEPDASLTARELESRARQLAGPRRGTFGREVEGLLLAEHAFERAQAQEDDEAAARALDTLAWALLAVGRDDEARAASEQAVALAPAWRRAELEERLTQIAEAIDHGRSEEGIAQEARRVAELEAALPELEERVAQPHRWRFADTEEGRRARWWHASLTLLVERILELEHPERGLLGEAAGAVSAEHGWSVPRRLAFAELLRERSAQGGAWSERWAQATEAVRSHPAYGGLELRAQPGLVPLGRDPISGLWEFWHVATGEEPRRGESGVLVVTETTGVVLVLLPGCWSWKGAQTTDPAGRNYDPQARTNERPVHEVELSPFFLSKYELTQGQWSRFVGENPSYYSPDRLPSLSLAHPVEQVSWLRCERELPRMGLRLPSEAQWEYGCRAGTSTPWWTGAERESLLQRRAANLADRAGARVGARWPAIADWPELDDGHGLHAPAGSYGANPFGLHEVHGNVMELCLDSQASELVLRTLGADPVALAVDETRVARGGSYMDGAAHTRSSMRFATTPTSADPAIGLRPARALER